MRNGHAVPPLAGPQPRSGAGRDGDPRAAAAVLPPRRQPRTAERQTGSWSRPRGRRQTWELFDLSTDRCETATWPPSSRTGSVRWRCGAGRSWTPTSSGWPIRQSTRRPCGTTEAVSSMPHANASVTAGAGMFRRGSRPAAPPSKPANVPGGTPHLGPYRARDMSRELISDHREPDSPTCSGCRERPPAYCPTTVRHCLRPAAPVRAAPAVA